MDQRIVACLSVPCGHVAISRVSCLQVKYLAASKMPRLLREGAPAGAYAVAEEDIAAVEAAHAARDADAIESSALVLCQA
jgi:hypothetical protein